MIKIAGIGLLIFVVGLFLATSPMAVVSAHGDDAQGSNPIVLHIHMGEFYFQLDGQAKGAPIVLEAGNTYVLQFHLDGKIRHEAMLGDPSQLGMEDGMTHGYETNLLDDVDVRLMGTMNGAGFHVDTMGIMEIELDQDQLMEAQFTLPVGKVGTWEIGCFLIGHYEAGMKIPLIVVIPQQINE
jgi:uncharacterized cupredoxin-like copper-binding protein